MISRNRRMLVALALVAVGCGAAARAGPRAEGPGAAAVPGAAPSASVPPSASAAPASSSPLASPPTRPDRGSGPNGCFTRDDLAARRTQAQTDNAATYVEALHRLGLEPVHLVSHRLVDRTGEIRGPVVPAHVEEREVAPHRRVRVIVMPPTGGCGDLSGAFDFARGGSRVWLVKRRVKSRMIDVALCGCPGCKCKYPPFHGCGGARIARTTILGYELPAGTVFAGEREVPYVEDFVDVVRALPPQPDCPPPPMPP